MTPNEEYLSIEELYRLFRYENGKLYNRITRNSMAKEGTTAGTWDGRYYCVSINRKRYMVSRIIWAMHNGRWPEGKLQIDHEDGLTYNNKIENLRELTPSENSLNRKNIKGYYKDGVKFRATYKKYSGPRRDSIELALKDRENYIIAEAGLGEPKAL